MKKITPILFKVFMLLAFIPSQLNAQTASVTTNSTVIATTTEKEAEDAAKATVLLSRLDEIKAMNKSEMSSSEKKELRKEVKSIKSELKATGNGVYLSVGAIIIIILLLILLL
ncbi:MAG: hypothetical protein NTZ59_13900 [Bacteroidetes bacterium]|nr:hypothetical protein [Bacteroidota bacterium]